MKFINGISIYKQISFSILNKVIKGEYQLGHKLPNIRSLAKEYIVTPKTIQNSINYMIELDFVTKDENGYVYITNDLNAIKTIKTEITKLITDTYLLQLNQLELSVDEALKYIKGK